MRAIQRVLGVCLGLGWLWCVANNTLHAEELTALAIADNGKVILGLAQGPLNIVQAPELISTASVRGPKPGDTGSITTFGDGNLVAIASKSLPRVDLWDVTRPTLFRRFELSEPATTIALSPDGTKLAVAGAFSIDVLEVETKKKLATLPNRHQAPALQWSSNNKLLGIVCETKVVVWFVSSNKVLMDVAWPTAVTKVPQLAFSPDGRLFATRVDKTTVVWDVAKKNELVQFNDSSFAIPGLAWSANGKELITATESELIVRAIDSNANAEPEVIRKTPIDFKAGYVWFSKDAKFAIGQEYNYRDTAGLHAIEMPTENIDPTAADPTSNVASTMKLSFKKTEKQLWSEPKLVRIAGESKPATAKPPKSTRTEIPNAQDMCKSMNFSDDGSIAVVGGMNGEIFVGKMPKGNVISRFRNSDNDSIESIAVSPNGKIIAAGSSNESLEIWSERGAPLALLTLDAQPVVLKFSPQGTYLLAATENTLYMFDGVHFGLIQKLQIDNGYLRTVAISNDEKWVALGDLSSVWLWSIDDDSIRWRVESGSAIVSGIAISPTNKTVVVDYESPVSELYDFESGNQFVLKDVMLESPAYLDEERILAGDGTRALHIVSAKDLTVIMTLEHPSGGVNIEAQGNRLLINPNGTAALFRGKTPFDMSDLKYRALRE
jgi:WD40 repeat protein